jgi:transcriptional regulator with XRE-family HTH domain
MTIGRLRKLYMQFAPPEPPKISTLTDNRLADVRKAYGLSRGEVAEALGINYRECANLEFAEKPAQEQIDAYLGALMNLAKLGPSYRSGVSFPKPTQQAPIAAAAAVGSSNDHFGDDTEDVWEDDSEDYEDEFDDYDHSIV